MRCWPPGHSGPMLKKIDATGMDTFLALSQLYEAEFAPITGAARDAQGMYPVSTPLDDTHPGYFYCEGEAAIGFAIIATESEPYEVCEFFIRKEYRKQGAGQKMAVALFNKHAAHWRVKQLHNATYAHRFWLRVLEDYTQGNFTQCLYEDEKWGKVHMQGFSSRA